MAPRIDRPVIGAFATQAVARALVSMPLQDRVSDGLHRRLLAAQDRLKRPTPDLRPPRGARALIAGVPGVRFAANRARRLRRPSTGGEWFARDRWPEQPRLLTWLLDEVLGAGPVVDVMGRRWADRVRLGTRRGLRTPTEAALQAAGAAALNRALKELPDLGPANTENAP